MEPNERFNWKASSMGILLGAVLAAVVPIPGSAASLTGSNFEIDTDANLKVDGAAPSIDWANVVENRKADTTSGPTDESFGGGTKEDTAVPKVVDGGIPPNKSDLKFFGVFQEGGTSIGFLHLFWSRVQDPSGTTNMDFEFNQKQCTPSTPPVPPTDPDCSANGITPIRTAGDLLITYDLAQGGTTPVLSKRTWTGTEWGPATVFSATTAIGSVNTSTIPGPTPGPDESDGLGQQDPFTFGEASIALSSIFPSNVCTTFGGAYLKSRSSTSFTSALKDFVPPVAVNISNCGTVKITKTDDAGTLLADATFELFKDNAPLGGSPPHGAEDTATGQTCTTTLPTGMCTIINVLQGPYWVVETATPPGHDTAADQLVNVTADAQVTVTFVDPRQLGAIELTKTAKHAGEGSPDLEATFTVTQGATTVGTIITDATTGLGCLGDLLPGSYTVTETTVPDGYRAPAAQTVTVTANGTCPSDGNPVSFENTPLSDITVSFSSQVPGGTKADIDCGLAGNPVDSTPGFNDTLETSTDLVPGTYTCTVVIDP